MTKKSYTKEQLIQYLMYEYDTDSDHATTAVETFFSGVVNLKEEDTFRTASIENLAEHIYSQSKYWEPR